MVGAYRRYFESGLYDRRYPSPNPRTLARVAQEIERRGSHVLDFGCGSGRYAAALVERSSATVIGYDLCPMALRRMSARHHNLIAAGRILPVGGTLADLQRALAERPPLDVVLLAFGVIGHIAGSAARSAVLEALLRAMRPGAAIILGVPNIRRRFRGEQRRARGVEPGDITYVRQSPDGPIHLFYHLYREEEILAELRAVGLVPLEIRAESILPERLVAAHGGAAILDRLLARVAPLREAYGFLVVAERPEGGP